MKNRPPNPARDLDRPSVALPRFWRQTDRTMAEAMSFVMTGSANAPDQLRYTPLPRMSGAGAP